MKVPGRENIAVLQRELGNLDAAADSLETAIDLATKLNHPESAKTQEVAGRDQRAAQEMNGGGFNA
ncbi:MAG: hypothetical protein U0350_19315 [Caldilineaceae bacterium]